MGWNDRAQVRTKYTTILLLCLAEGARAEDMTVIGRPSAFAEARQSLAESGVTIEGSLTNFGQGIVSGDGSRDIAWGNRGDLILRFDGGKLGLWDGLSLTLHQEVVWGDDANFSGDGSIIPVNTALAFPPIGGDDANLSLSLTQAFGSKATVSVGKFSMLDAASRTPILGGGGLDTFMNTAFAAPISGVTPPYILGGIATYRTTPAIYTLMIYDPRNAADPDVVGDPFETGVTTSLSVTFPARPRGLPGFYSIRGVYSTQDGLDLASTPQLFLPPEAQDIQTKDGYWYASMSMQQYLRQDPANPEVGWGVFGQVSVSDGNPNPINWSVIAGIGGRGGLIRDRDDDTWGVGYFYYGLSEDLKSGLDEVGMGLDDEQGLEAFYNLAVTPWMRVTAGVQWIDPATPDADDAIIAALRTQIRF
jgi:porin